MRIEKFDIERFIGLAERYPEFEEKFIKRFDSKEAIEGFTRRREGSN